MDGVISERHVADDRVEVIIRERCFLKSLDEYSGIRIELLGDSGGDGIQFDARPVTALHRFRHDTKEVPYAHGRLQYLDALTETHIVQTVPDGLDDLWRRVMRVRRRG